MSNCQEHRRYFRGIFLNEHDTRVSEHIFLSRILSWILVIVRLKL